MRKKLVGWVLGLTVLLAITIILGCMPVIVKSIIDKKVKTSIVINPNKESWRMSNITTVTMIAFNITNLNEVLLDPSIDMIIQEVGPFVYKKTVMKTEVYCGSLPETTYQVNSSEEAIEKYNLQDCSLDGSKDIISYIEVDVFTFDEEHSVGNPYDYPIYSINLIYQGALAQTAQFNVSAPDTSAGGTETSLLVYIAAKVITGALAQFSASSQLVTLFKLLFVPYALQALETTFLSTYALNYTNFVDIWLNTTTSPYSAALLGLGCPGCANAGSERYNYLDSSLTVSFVNPKGFQIWAKTLQAYQSGAISLTDTPTYYNTTLYASGILNSAGPSFAYIYYGLLYFQSLLLSTAGDSGLLQYGKPALIKSSPLLVNNTVYQGYLNEANSFVDILYFQYGTGVLYSALLSSSSLVTAFQTLTFEPVLYDSKFPPMNISQAKLFLSTFKSTTTLMPYLSGTQSLSVFFGPYGDVSSGLIARGQTSVYLHQLAMTQFGTPNGDGTLSSLSGLFIKRSAGEMFFGYYDPVIGATYDGPFGPPNTVKDITTDYSPSVMRNQTVITVPFKQPIILYSGTTDWSAAGSYFAYSGTSSVTYVSDLNGGGSRNTASLCAGKVSNCELWDTTEVIKGSIDGIYGPALNYDKKPVHPYVSQVKRVTEFVYLDDVKYRKITLHRFIPANNLVQNSTIYPPNENYGMVRDPSWTLPMRRYYGLDLIVSFPHFAGSDPTDFQNRLTKYIAPGSLHPNLWYDIPSDTNYDMANFGHLNFLDMNDVTGATFRAGKKLQLSVRLENSRITTGDQQKTVADRLSSLGFASFTNPNMTIWSRFMMEKSVSVPLYLPNLYSIESGIVSEKDYNTYIDSVLTAQKAGYYLQPIGISIFGTAFLVLLLWPLISTHILGKGTSHTVGDSPRSRPSNTLGSTNALELQ